MNNSLPRWVKTMNDKKNTQISAHEARFGKLGELQTPEQKKALRESIAAIEKDKKNAGDSNN